MNMGCALDKFLPHTERLFCNQHIKHFPGVQELKYINVGKGKQSLSMEYLLGNPEGFVR